MQIFTDAHREVSTTFHVWYYNGQEIDAYRTLNRAEADLRRALKAGWGSSSMYILDSNGDFLFAGGLATGHRVVPEQRDAITGLKTAEVR